MSTQVLPTLVYIVARGHSGSTLLELLLNASSNVAAMGEIDLLNLQLYRDHRTRWEGTCSCGARPYDCDHWRPILQAYDGKFASNLESDPFSSRLSDVGLEEEFGRSKPLSLARHLFHRSYRYFAYGRGLDSLVDLFPIYRRWVERRDFISEQYARRSNVRFVVDASKDLLHMRDLQRYSRLPVKIIFLTRDVRGLAWSAKRNENVSVEHSAKEWVSLNSSIQMLLEPIPTSQWMQVKYEDICSNSEAELARIHEFLGASRTPLSPELELSSRHTIAGNAVRFKQIDSVREDLAWQKNLSADELNTINAIAADAAKTLNYQL